MRFAISADDDGTVPATGSNGYGGVPAMRGLGRHYELDVCCVGRPDERTGYFLDIKVIDAAARVAAVPVIARACRERAGAQPEGVLAELMAGLNAELGGTVESVRWRLSPTYSVEAAMKNPGEALMRQRFEIAAAHRLHVPGLSDEENRRLFGKCNNPSGHGHNYVIEPAVRVPTGGTGAKGFTLADLERITKSAVLDAFDHTHLNVDTPEFRDGSGVNPSVENIARVFFERLRPAIAGHGGAELASVRVWETEKTSATYPG